MSVKQKSSYFKTPFGWEEALPMLIPHTLAFYGVYLGITGQSNWKTVVFFLGTFIFSGISVTMGAHRLWCHRTYEAVRPLRLYLLFLLNYTAHYSVYDWVLYHRIHHKYSDTDADPHNRKRGFFYSQIGWLFVQRTKEFEEKSKILDMNDIKADPDVMFQKRYFPVLLFLHWSIATLIPCYLWNETLLNSFSTLCFGFIVVLHQIFTINSICHSYGWKPYELAIEPTFFRIATYLANGEGYHNFHHAFPYDYSASELKWADNYNISTFFIDLCAHFGWVKNKKVASPAIIHERRLRTGDKSAIVPPRWSVLLDYIFGVTVWSWTIWTTLGLRYKTVGFI